MLDERRQLPPERGSVLGAQVYLVLRAADREPHRLILERDGDPLRHPRPPLPGIGDLTVQDQPIQRGNRNAANCQPRTDASPWWCSALASRGKSGRFRGNAEAALTLYRRQIRLAL